MGIAFTAEEDDVPELGIKIWGVVFALYRTWVYLPTDIASIREPGKFEFGESLRPINKLTNAQIWLAQGD